MFTGLHEHNWVLRLPERGREAVKAAGGAPFQPLGRTMKEYVTLPESLQSDRDQLEEWIAQSLEFVSQLPLKIKKEKASK